MTGLFGQTVIDPMPSEQRPLFHEPVSVPAVTLPGTTAADARIARKFDASATPSMFDRKVIDGRDYAIEFVADLVGFASYRVVCDGRQVETGLRLDEARDLLTRIEQLEAIKQLP